MRTIETVEYHKLRPRALVERREKMPVAYIGLGVLEWHGLHNPIGLDGLKADGVAKYLASRLGGIVMPPHYWGDHREVLAEIVFDPEITSWMPEGSINHTAKIAQLMKLDKKDFDEDAKRSRENGGWELWTRLMVHTFFQIQTLGFRMIVPIPGHYPLVGPLREAINTYKQLGGNNHIFPLYDAMYTSDGKAGDHAAAFETSLLMALDSDLVDLSELDEDLSQQNVGVLGDDPRTLATKKFGEQILEKFEQVVWEELMQHNFIKKS